MNQYEADCPQVWARARRQAQQIPAIYGGIDFDRMPERFVDDPQAQTSLRGPLARHLPEVLADRRRVAMIAGYAMTGDVVADAYAALTPRHGFRATVAMLETACRKGLEAVPGAPPELEAFIADMARTPAWVDMDRVREGARLERNGMANLAPYAIRGALLATFMNRYSALPMALTGALTDSLAAKRAFETATFFTLTVMPGGLERHAEGFRAAAMVRLMHSMVRFNVMRRPGLWDAQVYGVPIPQVDQMPAGLIGAFLLSFRVLAKGRDWFTEEERCRVELARYRCFLLGLPEDLLGETPKQIVELLMTRQATLRHGFDDATCGALVRGAMNAELSKDFSPLGRARRAMERSFSRAYLVNNFLEGSVRKAHEMGVPFTRRDQAVALASALFLFPRLRLYDLAMRTPVLREIADRRLVAKLRRRLDSYGHAEFISDAENYRPATAA
ncbi:oxygenase MpaB family protein [Camelimonas abortus]|uniref:Oxygenase MpaB family protein n=1 Tax=Camelimonas abortus TaxID=1017184 RepID=A0ABV7LAG8_9HYPH